MSACAREREGERGRERACVCVLVSVLARVGASVGVRQNARVSMSVSVNLSASMNDSMGVGISVTVSMSASVCTSLTVSESVIAIVSAKEPRVCLRLCAPLNHSFYTPITKCQQQSEDRKLFPLIHIPCMNITSIIRYRETDSSHRFCACRVVVGVARARAADCVPWRG